MDMQDKISFVITKNENILQQKHINVNSKNPLQHYMGEIKSVQKEINNYLTELVEKEKEEIKEDIPSTDEDESDCDSTDINLKRKVFCPPKENKRNRS